MHLSPRHRPSVVNNIATSRVCGFGPHSCQSAASAFLAESCPKDFLRSPHPRIIETVPSSFASSRFGDELAITRNHAVQPHILDTGLSRRLHEARSRDCRISAKHAEPVEHSEHRVGVSVFAARQRTQGYVPEAVLCEKTIQKATVKRLIGLLDRRSVR